MPDIIKPGDPNYFTQSQGLKADAVVNTGSAERTMADLRKVMEDCAKSFGVAFTSATKDTLKGQENFYKYIGDKENERRVAIERYKRAAIDSVNEETKAVLASYEEKARAANRSQEEINKGKVDLAKKAEDQIRGIEIEAAKKPSKIHGMIGRITEFAGGVGGPIGSTVAGLGNLLTNPYTGIATLLLTIFDKVGQTMAGFSIAGSQLASAGFRGGEPGAEALAGRIRGVIPFGAMSQDQELQMLATVSGSRTLTSQVGHQGGAEAFAGNLGLFSTILPNVAKETELFTDATKSLGMSQQDITNTFISSRVNADRLKITQLDAISSQIEMQKALRNITNDGTVAASVLGNIGGFLESMGTTSEEERKRMTLGIAQSGANLSLPQIAGMFAFTHGGRIPGPEQIFGEGGLLKHGGVFGLMGGFLQQVGNQFKDPTQRMFAADQLRQQFMPGLRMQEVPQFFNIANAMQQPGANMVDLTNQFTELEKKTPQTMMAEGIKNLGAIVDPFTRLMNMSSTFWENFEMHIRNAILGIAHGPKASLSKKETAKRIRDHNQDALELLRGY